MTLPPDNHERREAWLEDVYSAVHAKLGGDPNQQGKPERRYGAGVFMHAADYKPGGEFGKMVFSIMRLDLLGHPRTQVHTLDWYSIAPSKVAADLIAAYNALAAKGV